jgi:hypothetical protein
MTWTSLTFAYGSTLTSAKMTQMQDNFAALANADAGAPAIQEAVGGSGAVFANLKNDQTGYATAAFSAESVSGDVWIALLASGATAAGIRHARGGSGISVYDSTAALAPITASSFIGALTGAASDNVLNDAGAGGVGTILVASCTATNSVASGATISGGSLNPTKFAVTTDAVDTSASTLSGTWRNIGLDTIDSYNAGCLQRIS